MADPDSKAAVLVDAFYRGDGACIAAFEALHPSAEDVIDVIRRIGKRAGRSDKEIYENVARFCEKLGLTHG